MCFGIPTFDAGVKHQMCSIITHVSMSCYYISKELNAYIYIYIHMTYRYVIYPQKLKKKTFLTIKGPFKCDMSFRLATPPLLLMHFPVLAMASTQHPNMEPQIDEGWVWKL